MWSIALFIGLTMTVHAHAAVEFVIHQAGHSTASVVLLGDSGPMAMAAARDLRRVLGVMTGTSPELGSDALGKRTIVAGLASDWARLTNDAGPVDRLSQAAPESFVLLSSADRLLILGKDVNGVSHGIYTLLRELGCRWYFIAADWELIPRRAAVSVRVDRVEGPVMRMRMMNSGMGQGGMSRTLFEDWKRRNRLGSAYGRTNINHAYANFVPGHLFKDHPDYFAWVSADGMQPGDKQNGLQPCTTHPEVVKMFTEGALSILRKRGQLDPAATGLISVSPNDNTGNMCRCERCRQVGSYSDCALLLANQVAEALQGEFPKTKVGFMAYGRVSPPPTNISKAHPNVIVSMATNFTWNTFFHEMLNGWPGVVDHLVVREYYSISSWGGEQPDYTGPKISDLSRTIRQWHQRGIEGIEAEMSHSWASCGHRFWAAAELMWNPELSEASLMADFYSNCWGASAGPIRRYYERWEAGHAASPRVLGLAFQDLAEAARLADSPQVLRRVNLLTLYLHRFHLLTQTERVAEECRRLGLGEDETQQRLEQYCEAGNALTYRWKDAYLLPIQPKAYNMTRPYSPFTSTEVAAILEDSLKFYQSTAGPLVETGGASFSMDLVPLPRTSPLAPAETYEVIEGLVGTASHLIRGQEGEELQLALLTPPPRPDARPGSDVAGRQSSTSIAPDRGDADVNPEDVSIAASVQRQGRIELWFLGEGGQDKQLMDYRTITSSPPPSLSLRIPRSGLYQLNAKIARGKSVQVQILNRPSSIVADMKSRSDIAPLAQRARNERGVKPASLYYFFVPPETSCFALRLARLKSARPIDVALSTVDGELVWEALATKETEWLVHVPPQKAGAIWRIRLNTDSFFQLGFDGIPPYVASHPANLFIPRKWAGEMNQ
jgi:hypothetical protein